MQLCKLNYEKIFTPYTHILILRKREREERKGSTLTLEHSTAAMWVSGSSFLPLRLDFSAGRRVYERARKILSQP